MYFLLTVAWKHITHPFLALEQTKQSLIRHNYHLSDQCKGRLRVPFTPGRSYNCICV